MSEFFHLGYQENNLVLLNIVCRFQNLLCVSDIVKCNRSTINEFVTSEFSKDSIQHIFPQEEPTPADFRMWRDTIHRLGNGSTRLPYTLGHFIREPHLPSVWYTYCTATRLFCSNNSTGTEKCEVYLWCEGGMRTRHGAQYTSGVAASLANILVLITGVSPLSAMRELSYIQGHQYLFRQAHQLPFCQHWKSLAIPVCGRTPTWTVTGNGFGLESKLAH
jgi:hypothetical protein